jgi:hypothetical protein
LSDRENNKKRENKCEGNELLHSAYQILMPGIVLIIRRRKYVKKI